MVKYGPSTGLGWRETVFKDAGERGEYQKGNRSDIIHKCAVGSAFMQRRYR